MFKTLCIQGYTVRDMTVSRESTQETLKKLKEFGYTGIQAVSSNMQYGEDEFVEDVKASGLQVVGTHLPVEYLLDAEKTAKLHKAFGTEYAGIGGLPAVFKPDVSLESFMAGLNEVNTICEGFAKYGLTFTYHHHACEFAKLGNERMIDILMREMLPNGTFVLDTYWLNHAGADVLEWIDKLAGRVKILHLKDKAVCAGKNEGYITELGAGNINFKEVIRVAEQSGVEHLCYEQDANFAVNSLESARVSVEYFNSII